MRIHLPAETWAEIFAWLNRRDIARKMEQLWDREFSPIAEKWLHEWSSNVKIGSLEYRTQAELRKCYYNCWGRIVDGHIVPIAEVDLPKNVFSFKQIKIRYFDNTVLSFLRRMQPLLLRNIHLSLESSQWPRNKCVKIALDHLLPMFNGGGGEFESVKLKYNEIPLLNDRRYASALLNTKMLILCCNSFNLCFELLASWLFTKRADGQPRMLVFPYHGNYKDFVTIIQKRFMAATTADTDESFPFIVRFNRHSNFNGFQNVVSNGQQLMRESTAGTGDYLLISCPLTMDNNERLAAEWKQKKAGVNPFFVPSERHLQLVSPELGPLYPIDDPPLQQATETSSTEANASEQPGTSSSSSKVLLKRNAQNEEAEIEKEEEEEVDCGDETKKKKRARLS